ncbi:hypothetical protein ASF41_18620 [Methylobacterium sp. Leaf111]|nr:hypothetical protein ASF41_18620 [Methylobacterium sp. Leaf111]
MLTSDSDDDHRSLASQATNQTVFRLNGARDEHGHGSQIRRDGYVLGLPLAFRLGENEFYGVVGGFIALGVWLEVPGALKVSALALRQGSQEGSSQ